ncbi:MAG: MFS transporter, partial [Alphaproteobacteria bacterium]|nr:MFS transporter [Alphaproteobacteria bacterium]
AAFLPPRGLRLWAGCSALLLAGLSAACAWAQGSSVIVLRALAGLPEGILLWITVGMIARHATPERLSAVLLAAMTAAQFLLALVLTVAVLPDFGAAGGFVALALGSLVALLAAFFMPANYAPLVKPVGESAAPPARGWIALLATVVFTASFAAVAVYLQPIAHQAGHDAEVARLALTVSLLAQLVGGSVASGIAGRVHYLPVLLGGSAVYLVCWAVMGSPQPSWAFIAANALAGFCYLVITPFLVPMLIEADPSRRAAMMSGGAQVLAGALGPLASSQLVSGANVHPALWLAAMLMLSGLAVIAGLYVVERRQRALRQLVVLR